jgi:hypothetical protein
VATESDLNPRLWRQPLLHTGHTGLATGIPGSVLVDLRKDCSRLRPDRVFGSLDMVQRMDPETGTCCRVAKEERETNGNKQEHRLTYTMSLAHRPFWSNYQVFIPPSQVHYKPHEGVQDKRKQQ